MVRFARVEPSDDTPLSRMRAKHIPASSGAICLFARTHDALNVVVAYFEKSMLVVVASVILLAATPTAVPVRVTLKDLVGKWATVSGDCSEGQHLFAADGKYKVWCFNSVSEGEWSLRDANKIVVTVDPKTSAAEIITVIRVERYSDHTVLDIRYQNGTREKWTK
jgi:hypothetical protein